MGEPGSEERHTWQERFLRLFTDVRPGEGRTGLILLANIFLILTAYYFIKPVREGWLAVSAIRDLSKIEIKAYSSFGQTLLLLVAVPLYAWLASRWTRRRLINGVTLFFMANLVAFWLLQPDWLPHGVPYVGVTFYLWVGVFSVTVVAQFWSFAADMYSNERGKRLFPMIAIGGAAGGVVGAWLSARLISFGVGTFDLLLVALLPLALALALTWAADLRGVTGGVDATPPPEATEPAAADPTGPFELIVRHRYLLAVALFGLLVNWVNTNGENILYGVVQEALQGEAREMELTDPAALKRFVKDSTTAFYGNLYFWVNLVGLLLQALIVSRVLKYGGFAALICLTPFVAFMSYSLMTLFPFLMVIKVMKIAENSANYSVNNTARHVLWLPTPREMIYKAKTTIDTFFVRLGDGLAALTIFVGVQMLRLTLVQFLLFNLALVLAWIAVAVTIARENRRMAAAAAALGAVPQAEPSRSPAA